MDRRERARRRRRRKQNKGWMMFAVALALVLAAGGGIWTYQMRDARQKRHVTAGKSVNMGSGYRNVTYKGKRYQYNSLITTVLYAGIDSEGTMQDYSYTDAPRADSINLVVLDKKNKKMTIVAINRDTMTEIRRYGVTGKDRGTYVSHLGLAYTYGDGGEVSCENLREAVSSLLKGIPINEYVVTNRSSMPYINDLVGGVTVTVPNNDLASEYPEFRAGAQAELNADNIETYLRKRDTGENFSNEGRIERQQSYVTAYVEKFKALIDADLNGTWNKVSDMDDYIQTSITKNKYLKLANLVSELSFGTEDFCVLEGEDQAGELHDEFYVDEDALYEKVIELFYEEL